jgi:hypothetical protein
MAPSASGHLFCFGLGYSALALARQLAGEGWMVAGTSRTTDQVARLRALGFAAEIFDRDRPLPTGALRGITHVLVSIPPDAVGDPALDCHGDDLAGSPGLAWLGYLSTTGVYGDRGGDWIDETSVLSPTGERGQRRVAAEQAWLDAWRDRGLPVHIFRLAAIYGPGRSPFAALRAGAAKRIDKPGQVFSRIHVDDLAQVLRASIARPRPGAVYNVCDNEPAPPAAVTAHAARLLGIDPPPLVPFEAAGLSPIARSFYDDNKRVRNALIKSELGIRLRYPDYRTGLAAVLAQEVGAAQ